MFFGLISYRNYQTVYRGLTRNEISTYIDTVKFSPREVPDKSYLGYIYFTVKREGLFTVNLVGQPIYSDNVVTMTNGNEAIQKELLEKGYEDGFQVKASNKKTYFLVIRNVSKKFNYSRRYIHHWCDG